MKYDKTIEDIVRMQISDNNIVTLTELDEYGNAVLQAEQQLEEDEIKKIIAEFEDPSGDSMYGPDSVFEKHRSLHAFRP